MGPSLLHRGNVCSLVNILYTSRTCGSSQWTASVYFDCSSLRQTHFSCQGRPTHFESSCPPFCHDFHATSSFSMRLICASVTLNAFPQIKLSLMRWRRLKIAPSELGNMGIQPWYPCKKIRANCASMATRKSSTATSSYAFSFQSQRYMKSETLRIVGPI